MASQHIHTVNDEIHTNNSQMKKTKPGRKQLHAEVETHGRRAADKPPPNYKEDDDDMETDVQQLSPQIQQQKRNREPVSTQTFEHNTNGQSILAAIEKQPNFHRHQNVQEQTPPVTPHASTFRNSDVSGLITQPFFNTPNQQDINSGSHQAATQIYAQPPPQRMYAMHTDGLPPLISAATTVPVQTHEPPSIESTLIQFYKDKSEAIIKVFGAGDIRHFLPNIEYWGRINIRTDVLSWKHRPSETVTTGEHQGHICYILMCSLLSILGTHFLTEFALINQQNNADKLCQAARGLLVYDTVKGLRAASKENYNFAKFEDFHAQLLQVVPDISKLINLDYGLVQLKTGEIYPYPEIVRLHFRMCTYM